MHRSHCRPRASPTCDPPLRPPPLPTLSAPQFFEANAALLQEIPPPKVAVAYYRNEDLYMVGPQRCGL
jgi:hypothetical protein